MKNCAAAANARSRGKTVQISRSLAVLTFFVIGICPSPIAAQTINPTAAEFSPSPDHNTTAVSSYQIEFYLSGASAPFSSATLGKPAPQSNGTIRVDLTTIFLGWPVPGTVYTATVAAVGPGGSARSAPSNTFSFSSCTYGVSPVSANMAAGGGPNTTFVTTASGCAWSATSNAMWLTITSGAGGNGNGTVAYSVAANTGTTSRTGTLTVAGRTVTVTQQGVACSYSVSPTTLNPAAAASSTSVSVTTTSGCGWTATETSSWLTITSGASGSGSGSVAITIGANTSTSSRTATLTVAGQTVTVNQAAGTNVPPAPKNLRISQ